MFYDECPECGSFAYESCGCEVDPDLIECPGCGAGHDYDCVCGETFEPDQPEPAFN